MSFTDWLKTSGLSGGLSPAAMFQLGQGLATTMRKPVMPALVEPAKNPYADADPRRRAMQQLQSQNYAEEAAAQQAQQKLVLAENLRDSVKKAREITQFRSEQALSYSGAGVRLQGTPLIVLEETRKLGQQEIDATTQAAIARADLMRRRSLIFQNEGKAQMLGADIAWSTARDQFDMREQSSYALSQVRRNTGDSRIGNILSSLGGLLPGYSGTARVNKKRTPPPTPPPQTPPPQTPLTPTKTKNPWLLPENERDY